MNNGSQASKCLLNDIKRFPFYMKACNLLEHEELFRMMMVWMLPWHWRSFLWIPWPYSFLAWYHIRYVSRFRKHPLVLSPLLPRSHKCNFLPRWYTPWRNTIKRIILAIKCLPDCMFYPNNHLMYHICAWSYGEVIRILGKGRILQGENTCIWRYLYVRKNIIFIIVYHQ